ncbi:hypothetical protein [Chitinophaga sp. CF418]|uniref:hypothetical protein n=1 Tax=Chitinophaga sp. CF418 TaxID=1855287 RepID=UPI000912AEE9|nr:hypothetical protein [Chitinophaga sp. CF418]SHM69974.1 hypothetical protein SAMN05216311_1038 [Chitinophaga sp. CF418]
MESLISCRKDYHVKFSKLVMNFCKRQHSVRVQLGQIAINAPIIDYYCQLISSSLKKDNQGKEQELKETQAEIDKLYIRIQNARSLRLDDEFTAEEFKEIKADLTKKIENLEKKKTKLLSTNDNYQEYLSQGGEIMKNIATRYISASPIGKKQIIGSIFAEKLIFSDNKFRTTEPNIILELISRPIAGSDDYKKAKGRRYLRPFALVPGSGMFSNQVVFIISKLMDHVAD